MAPDFQKYLATEIISEQRTVSYRNVSRALKVHVNAAKCMLFEFYEKESKKKPGSIYATYLVSGRKKQRNLSGDDNEESKATNGDVPMPSSPPPIPSSMPGASQNTEQVEERYQVPIKTVTLCREEKLDSVKEQYEQITSVHMYALSPLRVPDLATLTDTGRAVFVDHHVKQDPLIHNKEYGLVQNSHVWRRQGKRPINIDMPQPKLESKTEPMKKDAAKTTTKPATKAAESAAGSSRPSSRDSNTTQDSASRPKPNLKRDGSSLFKAFAKQGGKPKLERKDTDTSAGSDAKMSGMDDNDEGESEEEAMFLDTGTTKGKKRPSDVQREKEERQAKLRKIMDDDDEDEKPAVPKVDDATDMHSEPPAAKGGEVYGDTPVGDGEDVAWSDSDTERKTSKPPAASKKDEEGPRRRRGKRKVMKKRTMKDEEGFLVTREEEAWESFSEDEPEPAKKPAFPPVKSSAPPKSQTQKSSAPKSSAGGIKKKDIMSFFGKK